MGEQLTAQFQRAQTAQLEIVTFGAMCIQAEAAIGGTCAINSTVDSTIVAEVQKRGPGRFAFGTGLKGWLAKYAPAVEYTKARRYRDISEALVGKLDLTGPDQLKLLTAVDGDLDKKLTAKRAKLLDLVTDQSVRGLQLELGLTDPAPARGGAREKKAGAEPAELQIPGSWFWVTPQQRTHFATLSENQRKAWLIWTPRMLDLSNATTDDQPLWALLDEQTKGDLVTTLEELLSKLRPSTRR